MSCSTQEVFTKDPDATLDYIWDWTAWLGDDEISAVEFTADAALTIEHTEFSAKTATAWLSGGVAYKTYIVSCRITTTGLRVEDRSVKIFCAQH